MIDRKYEKDPYDANMYEAALDFMKLAEDDPKVMVEYLDQYLAAKDFSDSVDEIIRKNEIDKRRLNQKHAEKLRFGKFKSFILGTALGVSLLVGSEQFKGTNLIANQVNEVVDDFGYGFREDSHAGIIVNQGNSYVDYETAINNIINKCEGMGMTPAQIDVGLKAILGVKPEHSTIEERIVARNDAYHASKVEAIGMGK